MMSHDNAASLYFAILQGIVLYLSAE